MKKIIMDQPVISYKIEFGDGVIILFNEEAEKIEVKDVQIVFQEPIRKHSTRLWIDNNKPDLNN